MGQPCPNPMSKVWPSLSTLSLLQTPAWPKKDWDTLVKTRIVSWHERNLRNDAVSNSKMQFLNVQLYGLSGRSHPALQGIMTTQDAKKLRLHLKFLTCDFMSNKRLSLDQPNISSACSLCNALLDSTSHILVSCRSTSDVRSRLWPELMNTVAAVQPMSKILDPNPPPELLTLFILDCSSFNLPCSIRIPAHNPKISAIYRVARDWCFGIASERFRLFRLLRAKTTWQV